MNEVKLDLAFSKFLDDEHCEMVSDTLYQLIHSAFIAGWKSALGSGDGKVMNIEPQEEGSE